VQRERLGAGGHSRRFGLLQTKSFSGRGMVKSGRKCEGARYNNNARGVSGG
jgi:hypothetical protein